MQQQVKSEKLRLTVPLRLRRLTVYGQLALSAAWWYTDSQVLGKVEEAYKSASSVLAAGSALQLGQCCMSSLRVLAQAQLTQAGAWEDHVPECFGFGWPVFVILPSSETAVQQCEHGGWA